MPLTEKELLERDAKRDIGAELLQSVREMMVGEMGRVYQIELPPTANVLQDVSK